MPLTDLAFLEEGSHWPPPSEKDRLNRYAKNKTLWAGDHDQVFGNWWRVLRADKAASLELVFNWHKRLSTLWADLMLSEPPRFTDGADTDDPNEELLKPEDKALPSLPGDPLAEQKPQDKPSPKKKASNPRQDALDRIVDKDDNGFVNTLYEVALDISRFGNGLAKVTLDEHGAEIWAQPPTYWFPITTPHNLRKIVNHVLAWEFEKRDPVTDTTTKYLWIEIHHKGLIEYRVNKLTGNMIGERHPVSTFAPDQPEVEQTNVPDEFLVVPFACLQASDELYGVDDYKDLDSVMSAIEVRASQINRVLDQHTDPSLYGPPDQLTYNPTTQKMEFVSGGSYIEVEEDDVVPAYLTWDGQLEAQFNELEFLLEQLYLISETTPAAFGQQKEGLAESGSALRRLMMAPLIKVARMTKSFDPAAKKTLRIAAKLEAANGHKTPPLDHIQIEWQDGLPGDPLELAQAEQIRTNNSATSSIVASIQRLDGGSREEAEAEAERINLEGQQKAQQTLAQTDAELALAAKHTPPGDTPPGQRAPSSSSSPNKSRSSS